MKRLTHQTPIAAPKVSIILLDWSVRESLHSLAYLNGQKSSRQDYELIWIEYYGRQSEQLRDMLLKESSIRIDQWIILDMPENCYYHKHMMYNIGIAVSRSEIVCICDSDAVFNDTFVDTIISEFTRNDRIVLHLDEVRNNDKKFYPFNYPSVAEVLGAGAINWQNGKTTGVRDKVDPLHTRNYGACFCAKREELIKIGGADEHIGFVGHICGPYDMTFRLVNSGCREIWHEAEYIYHTWHPGQAGDQNLLGPHDGRHMSAIALDAAKEGRVMPLKENAAIAALRGGTAPSSVADLVELAIDETYRDALIEGQLERNPIFQRSRQIDLIASLSDYRYNLIRFGGRYHAVPWDLGELDADKIPATVSRSDVFVGETEETVREQVIRHSSPSNGRPTFHQLSVRIASFLRRMLGGIRRVFQ